MPGLRLPAARQLVLAGFAAAGLMLGLTAAPAPAQADEVVLVHDHRGWGHHRGHGRGYGHGPRYYGPPPRARHYAPPPRYYHPPPVRYYYPPPPPRYYRPPPRAGIYFGF